MTPFPRRWTILLLLLAGACRKDERALVEVASPAPRDARAAADAGAEARPPKVIAAGAPLPDEKNACTPDPALDVSPCRHGAPLPRALGREIERLVERTAAGHTRKIFEVDMSYAVPVYLVRKVEASLLAASAERVDVLASFEATANPARDVSIDEVLRRRDPPSEPGRLIGAPAAPPTPERACVRLTFAPSPRGWRLEAPPCLPFAGKTSFRPRPVRVAPARLAPLRR